MGENSEKLRQWLDQIEQDRWLLKIYNETPEIQSEIIKGFMAEKEYYEEDRTEEFTTWYIIRAMRARTFTTKDGREDTE